jgi:hypothetical protein
MSSVRDLATVAFVVRINPAIDAAFCSAVRVTFVGSTTPASPVDQIAVFPVAAL